MAYKTKACIDKSSEYNIKSVSPFSQTINIIK